MYMTWISNGYHKRLIGQPITVADDVHFKMLTSILTWLFITLHLTSFLKTNQIRILKIIIVTLSTSLDARCKFCVNKVRFWNPFFICPCAIISKTMLIVFDNNVIQNLSLEVMMYETGVLLWKHNNKICLWQSTLSQPYYCVLFTKFQYWIKVDSSVDANRSQGGRNDLRVTIMGQIRWTWIILQYRKQCEVMI